METILSFITGIHYIFWALSFIATGCIVVKGSKAKLSIIYIGLIILLQGIFNGCVITDIQNFFLNKYNGTFVENRLLLTYIVQDEWGLLRFFYFIGGAILLFPSTRTLYEHLVASRYSLWARFPKAIRSETPEL